MVNKQSLSCSVVLSVALALVLACSWSSATQQTAASLTKAVLPEMSTKELKMNFKLFLTKMKVRRVPLAKARSEKLLAKLYHEERIIEEQIGDLKRNLQSVGDDPSAREGMKVIETRRPSNDDKQSASGGGIRRNLMVLSDLTQGRIDEWRAELTEKQRQLAEVQAKKDEAKNIIKNPESYISIPSNYGRDEPEEVQAREREILLNDRQNMNYRSAVEAGQENPPTWLTDHW